MEKKLEENKILIEKTDFEQIGNPVEIWWKPAFVARKDGKYFIMRWKYKYSDDFDYVERPFDNWWKPASWAEKRVKNGTYHFPIEIS
jgi:hypothetical protein